ncbi:MAG: 30S ribosomal protein S9 [Lentisphaerae bacterium]|jgi:small subunit ribosomal protein S9|nr:30S ribosomal protein S9 [Lentisphaerota bacterium]MBT4815342.1 30S ribosomal protein S9 [Lentisphaerota bacterium]MBT5610120.1 30S ribosomal protein S9 [Lentisphaerota bacterium]MBT7053588.1 30S ribosomal protein S9 [Lentisphaerota bacterium]MBT7842108.1 30S ribosomal protein S9 [Lentisphaerota bacterium]
MAASRDEVTVVGRRKSAVARVRLYPGTGKIVVNKRDFEQYFPCSTVRGYVTQPLMITGVTQAFDIHANIKGGGPMGQAGALRHGISRGLCEANAELRSVLKESGMLTRDARVKERKKPGQPGARKRFQFSKR